ncbi:MAG: 50S ribosomal protein L1 [Candidatus Giovannonibacteria bacterium GW2011_GWA2_53_7]|uniref:Large ribosomal subunit protein uL1 n=1 Tax=Candidatus Giovannonibacteria bacterium GW2011_GWA2_53_7 TaxID=1618650 RepID=A0A0G2A881_9BACT|nr:MAG: 50S ribosomal protein L1 [Candidatus Giovannonibacteria bacterium GW2011_GWA2_53_7]
MKKTTKKITHGTRYQKAVSNLDLNKTYTLAEALPLLKASSQVKFDASVEVHVRLGIDPAKSDQHIRGTITLPHGTGKSKKVAAFVEPDKEAEAKTAGAQIVGGEDLIAEIMKEGRIDFDVAIATPIMMPKIAKIAKILGQRGVMPNPKTDTVGVDVKKMVTEQMGGKVSFRNDATGNVHQIIGKVSFSEAQLTENFETLLALIKKVRPSSAKGIYIKSVTLATSMGPGIKVSI